MYTSIKYRNTLINIFNFNLKNVAAMDIQSKVIFGTAIQKSKNKNETQKTKDGTFKSTPTQDKKEISTAQQTFAVQALESIMMDLSQHGSKHQQAIDYGFNLLERLDELKQKLLLGDISLGDLEAIRSLLHPSRQKLDDPALEEILLEIETRVMVELAKLGK